MDRHAWTNKFRRDDDATRVLRELASSVEALLHSTAGYGDDVEAARGRLRRRLESAREHARHWEDAALERARRVSRATDGYVHENAWKTMAGAALIGLLAGICLGSGGRR